MREGTKKWTRTTRQDSERGMWERGKEGEEQEGRLKEPGPEAKEKEEEKEKGGRRGWRRKRAEREREDRERKNGTEALLSSPLAFLPLFTQFSSEQ